MIMTYSEALPYSPTQHPVLWIAVSRICMNTQKETMEVKTPNGM